jgi:prophage tail gpP-like protein
MDTVTEGADILEGREILFHPGIARDVFGIGQSPTGDDKSGSKTSHEPFSKTLQDVINGYSPTVIPLEIPAWGNQQLKGRVDMDAAFQQGTFITIYITERGWMRPSGGLWESRQMVSAVSPMLIMTGSEKLTAKSVTFLQDNQSGTRTILELCNDLALGGGVPGGPGSGRSQ